jgi:nuclear pore complex protein Nup133
MLCVAACPGIPFSTSIRIPIHYHFFFARQAIRGTPTCYIFSCPQDHTGANPPLHAFIPHAPLREPGLILVSHSGQVRLWENISTGLAGGENYSTMGLDVKEDEHVTNFVRVDVR